ncbi:UNVERIFIED_CONTAM: hypothetical protein GTU68_066285 [Idotea baltica]|nr:hypothetical protein [Idotea baltica]
MNEVGEALRGDGNEVAHIDLVIGHRQNPVVGLAFNQTLFTQSAGHSNLLCCDPPNRQAKIPTVMVTKVTIKGATQAVQMFGPAQLGVTQAVDYFVDNFLSDEEQKKAKDMRILVGVFVHWQAASDAKIARYNFEATLLALLRATGRCDSDGEPGSHPFAGLPEGTSAAKLLTCATAEFEKLVPNAEDAAVSS